MTHLSPPSVKRSQIIQRLFLYFPNTVKLKSVSRRCGRPFVFYHLTRFGYLKIYKNIFRCEELLKIMTLNTHRFSWKSAENVVFHRFYQTCLIIVGAITGGEIGEKIGGFFKKKNRWCLPHRFPCPTYRFFSKKSADSNRFLNRWLSVGIGGKNRLVGIRLKSKCLDMLPTISP